MSRFAIAAWFGFLLLVPVLAQPQQNGLTDGQLKAADAEVPQLVELLQLQPGMSIADIGAGFGAWTLRFSKVIGPSGRVYATEIGAPQLAALRGAVERERLTNVTVIEGATGASNLPPSCCDAVLIRDAYHHFTQPDEIVRSLAAALKPGGRLAVADFPPRPNSNVPPGVRANRGGHGVPSDVVEQEVGAVLAHVRTIPQWSTANAPGTLFLALFRKDGVAGRQDAAAEVLAFERQIEDAVVRGDVAFVDRATAPTFTFTHGDGWTTGGAPLRVDSRADWMATVARAPYASRVLDSVKTEVHGDVVITYGRYVGRFKDAAPGRRTFTVWFERVYARRAGTWQYLSHRTVDGPHYDPN